jgi:hypothetical protein
VESSLQAPSTPNVDEIAGEVLAPATAEVEPIQVGDRVRFTNPDDSLSLRHLEVLELEVVDINQTMWLATCKLPNGITDSFALHTLRKIE